MNNILRKISILLVLSLVACTSTQSYITASSGEDGDIGLGGTGKLANTSSGAGNGLGGTGILGEITGYGSIFVNGIEVEYDTKTPFTIDGETAAHQQLEIGDVVEVLTVDANLHTRAQIINLRHEIIGVVESVEPETYSFTVQGQHIIQSIDKSDFPEVGATVAVAGFRIDEKTILSSRITPARTGQVLVRKHTELPFYNKAQRWRVQTHIEKGRVTLEHDGIAQTFSIDEKTAASLNDSLAIRILQLEKSAEDKVEIKQYIEPGSMPRGRHSLNATQQKAVDIMLQPVSGTIQTPRSGTTPSQVPAQTPMQIPAQPQIKSNRR